MHDDLYSIPLERHVLATLYKHPDTFTQVEAFLSENDFSIPFHGTCFCVLKDSFFKKEKVDKVTWAQKLKNIGVVKYEDVDVFSYIENITYTQINQDAGLEACKELVKLRVLRELVAQNERAKEYIVGHRSKNLDEIVVGVDKINNEIVRKYEFKGDSGTNIFDTMEKNIEYNAANPPKEFLAGPFPTVNRLFGSITIPSNITLIGARTGANKTNLALFYSLYLASNYGTKILYLDYGELNLAAIQHRILAMMTKSVVPYHMIVRGTWASVPEYADIIRKSWKKIKNLTLIYYDVGNMSPKEILGLIKRAYYSKIGRDNKNALLVYDYLKPFDHSMQQADWQLMSQFAKDLKTLINNEIPVPAWMSVQMNRKGITNNRKAITVDDSEDSLNVDRILHNASLGFLLRQKTLDELQEEGNIFGNIKMIPVKHREILGDSYQDVFKPVRLADGSYKKNYINLEMKNFFFEDRGDLNQMTRAMQEHYNLSQQTQNDNATL
jgi:replicative DNA helicase